jgi:ubiquitin-protein ligase
VLCARRARCQALAPALLLPQSLLCDPNPNSPANSEAARLYNENRCAPRAPEPGTLIAVQLIAALAVALQPIRQPASARTEPPPAFALADHRREYNRRVREVVEASWMEEDS